MDDAALFFLTVKEVLEATELPALWFDDPRTRAAKRIDEDANPGSRRDDLRHSGRASQLIGHSHGVLGEQVGPFDLSQQMTLYVVVCLIFFGAFLLIWRIVHSPFGQVLKAIRENEARATSLGYDIDRLKLLAYVLSASLSGLAGGTKAIVFQLASLTDANWPMSGEVVLMTLLGGMGTLFGPWRGRFREAARLAPFPGHLKARNTPSVTVAPAQACAPAANTGLSYPYPIFVVTSALHNT